MTRTLQCHNCGASLEVEESSPRIIQCSYCGTKNVLPIEIGRSGKEYGREFTVKLRKALDEHFTTEETKELVLQLNGVLPDPYKLQYDDLPGTSQSAKTLELVLWCERRLLLDKLVAVVQSMRPTLKL
jgi:hypothetical protein